MYGYQCTKRLFLHKFAPELRKPMAEGQQAIFASGTNTGILAQDLFPRGVNAEPETPYEFHISVQKTKEFIAQLVKHFTHIESINEDVKDIKDSIKEAGFDPAILSAVAKAIVKNGTDDLLAKSGDIITAIEMSRS